jgi:hypothetical protein
MNAILNIFANACCRLCIALIFTLAALLPAAPSAAQDYEREARWASEVIPTVLVGEPVRIKASSGREFLALYAPVAARDAPTVVLVHGVGVHPDHGIIGTLRTGLHDQGFTTVSIQMPVAAKEAQLADYHPALFPDAVDRIAVAGRWVRARHSGPLILLSHSMGAWMSNEYFDQFYRMTPYTAWVAMGLTGGYSWTMRRYGFPILDLLGENDLPPVVAAKGRRRFALDSQNGSKQVEIAGADHHFAMREKPLQDAIIAFIRDVSRRPQ